MMLAVQVRACWAWYMARTVCSASGEIRSVRSAFATSSGAFARGDGRLDHLGSPPGRLRFGDPAGAVALHTEQTLDRGRPEPLGDLELDERHDRHLVLAQSVVGRRLRHADRLADDRQELERDPGPIADLLERLGGEGGEPLVGGRVEEVERQGATPDGVAHTFERDAGVLERFGHQHAAHVARREALRLSGRQDAELHESIEVGRLDPGSLGSLHASVAGHAGEPTAAAIRDAPSRCTFPIATDKEG